MSDQKPHTKRGKKKSEEGSTPAANRTFRAIIDRVNTPIVTTDPTFVIQYANQAFMKGFGYPLSEITGRSLLDLLPAESRSVLKSQSSQDSFSFQNNLELQVNRHDGFVEEVELSATLLPEIGKAGVILWQLHLITDRKQSEKALQLSERRFTSIFKQSPAGFAITRLRDNRILNINDAWLHTWGYTRDEVIGHTASDIRLWVYPEKREQLINQIAHNRRAVNFETVMRKKSGEHRNVLLSVDVVNIDEEETLLIQQVDITEAKQFEAALRHERDFNQALIQSAPAFFVAIQMDGRVRAMNDLMLTALGYQLDEVLGKDYISTFLPAEDRPALADIFNKISANQQLIQTENRVQTKDGRLLMVKWHGRLIGQENQTAYIIGLGVDITELVRSQTRLEATLNTLPDLLFELNEEGRLLNTHVPNPNLLYMPAEEVKGKLLEEFLPPEASHIIRAALNDALANGRHSGGVYSLQLPEGEKWFELSIAVKPATADEDKRLLLLARDITDRIELQKREDEQRELLDYHYKLVEILNSISTQFINLPIENIHAEIDQVLRKLGEFEKVDRSYVFLLRDEDPTIMDNTHEWCAPGIEPQIEHLKDVPISLYPWWIARMRSGEEIYIPNTAQLPPEAQALREALEPQGIQSLLAVPLMINKAMVGFIGFDAVQQVVSWSPDSIRLIKMTADVISNALARKKTQEAVQRIEKRNQALIENAPDGIALLDSQGVFEFISPSGCRMAGYEDPQEFLGTRALQKIHPDDRERAAASAFQVREKTASALRMEFRFLHRDGGYRWLESTFSRLTTDEDGAKVVVNFRDVTERKQMDEDLRERERQMRSLITSLDDIVFEVDETGTYQNVWTANEDMLFTPRDQIVGKRFDEIFGEEGSRPYFDTLARVLKTGRAETLEYSIGTGSAKQWFAARYNPIRLKDGTQTGKQKSISILVRDITPRKQAELLQTTSYHIAEAAQEAKSLQELYQNIHAQIGQIMDVRNFYIALFDESNDTIHFTFDVSEEGEEMPSTPMPLSGLTAWVIQNEKPLLHRYSQSEIQPILVGLPPKVWLGVPLKVANKTIGVLAVQHMTDEYAYTEHEQQVLEYASSQIGTAIFRKQSEETVRKIEKRNHALIQNAPDGIALVNAEGYFTFVSPSLCRITGYEEAELTSKHQLDFLHPEDLPAIQMHLATVLHNPSQPVPTDHRFRHKNGTYIWLESIYTNLTLDPEVNSIVLNLRDVTERKHAMDQLKKSQSSLQAAQAITRLGSWEENIKKNEMYWSDELYRICGLQPQEIPPTHEEFLSMVPPEDHDMVMQAYDFSVRRPISNQIVHRIQSKDGMIKYVQARYETEFDEDGNPLHTYGTVQDITERRKMELELEERIKELTCLFSVSRLLQNEDLPEDEMLMKIADNLAQGMQFPMLALPMIELGEKHYGVTPLTPMPEHALYETIQVQGAARGKVGVYYKTDRPLALLPEEQEMISNVARMLGLWLERQESAVEVKKAQHELEELNRDLERRVEERTAAVQKSEATYRALFENSNDGIFLISPQGKDLTANPQALKLLGYTLEEYLTLADEIVNAAAAPEERFDALDKFAAIMRGEHVPLYERTMVGKNGKKLNAEINLSPVHDTSGNIIMVQSVVRDISERKKAEETLRESRDQLSAANAALEKASRLKDEFLASMSHELRTPLTGILGLTEALQLRIYGVMNDKQMNALKNIENSGRHLLELINDILDLSKIEAGQLDLQIQACSLADVCQASLQLVKGMSHQKKQSVSFSMNPAGITIQADARRLKQMLVNLLSNAVKFTPDGGSLGLEVKASKEEQTVYLSVWDAGIGIEPEEMSKLFKPFIQLDSSLSRQYSGTGLGLSLVLRMAELHGGGIQVESTPGKGSRFTIALPWSAQETGPLISPKPSRLNLLKSVLVIENNTLDIEHASHYMTELGLAFATHSTVHGALQAVISLQPSVIMLDLNLPDGSGMDVLAQLKAEARTRDIPVIIASIEDRRSESMQRGAVGYLVKPFILQDLKNELGKAAEFVQPALASAENPTTPNSAPLIMLVDDNELILDTISDFMKALGYSVTAARSGYELLERISEVRPQLVLMDVQMPGMDGLETMRRVRSHTDASIASIPIITVTAMAMPGDREKCLAAGANEYLSKPIVLMQLADTVKQLLKEYPRILP